MSFVDAVKICLSKYVGFTGRARRSEFWYFWLFGVIVGIVGYLLDRVIDPHNSYGIIATIASLALLLPSLAVAIRRLHDTDRTGWWILIGFIPVIGTIVLLVFYVLDSGPDNKYGPNPKQVTQYAG